MRRCHAPGEYGRFVDWRPEVLSIPPILREFWLITLAFSRWLEVLGALPLRSEQLQKLAHEGKYS